MSNERQGLDRYGGEDMDNLEACKVRSVMSGRSMGHIVASDVVRNDVVTSVWASWRP